MAIKRLEAIYKFLQAARNLVKNKAMKKDDILRFAKQEFGEVSDFLRKQIDNLFKKGTPSESKIGEFFGFKNYPKTAQKKKGEVIPFNKQGGIVRRPEEFATRKEYEKYLDETLGPPDDVFGSPLKDDLLKEWDKVNAKNVTPDIKKVIDEKEGDDFIDFVRKSGDEEGANKIQKEVDRLNKAMEDANKRVEIAEGIKSTDEAADMVKGEINPKTNQMPDQQREFLGFPNRSVEAIVRTAARDVLEKAGLGPRIKDQDPIDMARQIYGEDFLEALDNIAGELQEASSYPEISRILTEKKIYNFKPRQGLDIKQKGEIEDITAFDPEGRDPNADGGLIDILKL